MAPEKDSRVTARIPTALRKRLEKYAAEDRRKLADYIRIALEEHVQRRARRAA